MQEISDITKIQAKIKAILEAFAAYCDAHGLIYNLYGGTLLGAVRHGDIIPWDDDIDVCMPRPDYEKLKQKVLEEKIPGCTLFTEGMQNYIYPFAKLSLDGTRIREMEVMPQYGIFGMYIDIFPFDAYPLYPPKQTKATEKKLQKWHRQRFWACADCRYLARNGAERLLLPLKRIWVTRGKSYKTFLQAKIDLALAQDYEEASTIACWFSFWQKSRISKQAFTDRVRYPFGNRSYWGPRDYDAYLTQYYGDYMTLPPEPRRVSNHSMKCYAEDTPPASIHPTQQPPIS